MPGHWAWVVKPALYVWSVTVVTSHSNSVVLERILGWELEASGTPTVEVSPHPAISPSVEEHRKGDS